MSQDLGTLSVKLEALTAEFNRRMKEAEGNLKSVDKTAKSIDLSTKFLAAKEAVGVLGKALSFAFEHAIKPAADMQENLNLLSVTFGKMTGDVVKWADTTAQSIGRSRLSVRETVGSFQALLDPILGNKEAAAAFSTQLTKLTYDMGSFFNVADADAMNALRSAIAGQTEPLRRFGVNLNEATLQQTALNMGIKESVADMTQAQKTAVVLTAAMAGLKNTENDLIETQGSFSNQLKRFNASLEEAGLQLGEALLPSLNEFLGLLNKILPPLIKTGKIMADVFTGIGAATMAPAMLLTGQWDIDELSNIFSEIKNSISTTINEPVNTGLAKAADNFEERLKNIADKFKADVSKVTLPKDDPNSADKMFGGFSSNAAVSEWQQQQLSEIKARIDAFSQERIKRIELNAGLTEMSARVKDASSKIIGFSQLLGPTVGGFIEGISNLKDGITKVKGEFVADQDKVNIGLQHLAASLISSSKFLSTMFGAPSKLIGGALDKGFDALLGTAPGEVFRGVMESFGILDKQVENSAAAEKRRLKAVEESARMQELFNKMEAWEAQTDFINSVANTNFGDIFGDAIGSARGQFISALSDLVLDGGGEVAAGIAADLQNGIAEINAQLLDGSLTLEEFNKAIYELYTSAMEDLKDEQDKLTDSTKELNEQFSNLNIPQGFKLALSEFAAITADSSMSGMSTPVVDDGTLSSGGGLMTPGGGTFSQDRPVTDQSINIQNVTLQGSVTNIGELFGELQKLQSRSAFVRTGTVAGVRGSGIIP